jgi:hypothetical protein
MDIIDGKQGNRNINADENKISQADFVAETLHI